jgi:sucrose-6-phosphate hydrolase SacC (GH32 family)
MGGFYECPDFFELPVDGNPSNKKWVLTAADSRYMVGQFNGSKFIPETALLIGHRGKGFYAAQTFSDIPSSDGRRIQIGWFQTETKGMPFNQSMTVPLELKLVSTQDGPRLSWSPVKELQQLVTESKVIDLMVLKPEDANPLSGIKAELAVLNVEFEPDKATEVSFNVRGAMIQYDVKRQDLLVNGYRTFAPLKNGKLQMSIYCDRTGLEIFASEGLSYIPMPFQPDPGDQTFGMSVKGGQAKIQRLVLQRLESAWKP